MFCSITDWFNLLRPLNLNFPCIYYIFKLLFELSLSALSKCSHSYFKHPHNSGRLKYLSTSRFVLRPGVEWFLVAPLALPWLRLWRCSGSHCRTVLMFNKCQCPELLSLLSPQTPSPLSILQRVWKYSGQGIIRSAPGLSGSREEDGSSKKRIKLFPIWEDGIYVWILKCPQQFKEKSSQSGSSSLALRREE